ncbi:hypothetical protein D3C85_1055140 [compost metagenome]
MLQYGIEFRKACISIGKEYRAQYIGYGFFRLNFTVLNLARWNRLQFQILLLLTFLGLNQTKGFFNFLPGNFGLIATNILHVYSLAILFDFYRNNVDVRMPGIVMLIDQIGLCTKTNFMHISSSNIHKFFF